MGGQIMKKGVILIAVFFLSLSAFGKATGSNWLETSKGKIDCKEINLGMTKATVILDDGSKVDINYDDINSFSRNGKLYNKLRLFEDNKPTNQMAFMELIKTWNDLSLYRLKVQNLESGMSRTESQKYYLYNGTNYHMQLDDRSLRNTCKEFGLNYAEM
jgi:hypothetical protein